MRIGSFKLRWNNLKNTNRHIAPGRHVTEFISGLRDNKLRHKNVDGLVFNISVYELYKMFI
jgi:hypothetical protein